MDRMGRDEWWGLVGMRADKKMVDRKMWRGERGKYEQVVSESNRRTALGECLLLSRQMFGMGDVTFSAAHTGL
jgi:hypothetical protein